MHTVFWLEYLKERDHSEDLGVDARITIELMLGNRVGSCGLWFRIGTSGRLF